MDKDLSLHEKLRLLRLEKNVTQDVAAEEMHITRACLSNYERGLRVPDVETLAAMEEYYGAEEGYLFPVKRSFSSTNKMNETSAGEFYKVNGKVHNLNDSINISKMPLSSKIALHSFYEYLNYCDSKMKKGRGK